MQRSLRSGFLPFDLSWFADSFTMLLDRLDRVIVLLEKIDAQLQTPSESQQ